MRVDYLAADGQPNWNANFASESAAPLPVLNAFIEALAHVKGQYDVNDEDQARIKLGPGLDPELRWVRWCWKSSSRA